MEASKFGADCNLDVSPEKVKLGCCKLEEALPVTALADELAPDEEDLRSIHGTATCLPALLELAKLVSGLVLLVEPVGLVELVDPVEPVDPVVLVDPVEPMPEPLLLRESTANSTRPDAALIMVSLIVPI